MTFFYDSFSLHCKLKNKGFEPEVSEDEFFIEFEVNDSRMNQIKILDLDILNMFY